MQPVVKEDRRERGRLKRERDGHEEPLAEKKYADKKIGRLAVTTLVSIVFILGRNRLFFFYAGGNFSWADVLAVLLLTIVVFIFWVERDVVVHFYLGFTLIWPFFTFVVNILPLFNWDFKTHSPFFLRNLFSKFFLSTFFFGRILFLFCFGQFSPLWATPIVLS